jgi:hypothetical protein
MSDQPNQRRTPCQPVPNRLPTTELPPIKLRHLAFLCYWAKNGLNASAAARRAGYSARSAHVTGHRILHNPTVERYLREILSGR